MKFINLIFLKISYNVYSASYFYFYFEVPTIDETNLSHLLAFSFSQCGTINENDSAYSALYFSSTTNRYQRSLFENYRHIFYQAKETKQSVVTITQKDIVTKKIINFSRPNGLIIRLQHLLILKKVTCPHPQVNTIFF